MPKQINENYKGSFKSVIDLSLIAKENDGALPKEIQVLPCGEFMTAPYGPLTIDEGIFDQMVGNFDRDVRKAVPIDVDHDGGKAAGWINKLINKGKDGLWAIVEWNKYGKELLTEKLYKLFSPEWSFDYVDPEHSTHHGAVLVAGSLTNRPLFKEMPLLVASDGTIEKNKDLTKPNQIMLLLDSKQFTANDMPKTLEEILKLQVADRSEDDLKVISEAKEKGELSDEQKAQLETENKPAETDAEKAAREAQEKIDADAKAKADADAAEAEKVEGQKEAETAAQEEKLEACETGLIKTGLSKEEAHTAAEKMIADVKAGKENVTIAASELKRLQSIEISNLKAQEELQKVEIGKEVEALIANDKGGKILPKSKDAIVNFILACSDAQKKDFMSILNALPDVKIAGEIGGDGKPLTAAEQLTKLVEDKMVASKTANEKMTKADAYRLVIQENPELAKAYDRETQEANKK